MCCFNALNGLLSFLHDNNLPDGQKQYMFQRPKRASFISTLEETLGSCAQDSMVSTP